MARGAAKVYAAVRELDKASPLRDQYQNRIVPIRIDLAQPDTIAAAAQQASDVHMVVNNAGVLTTNSPFDDDALRALQYEMDVNVYGLLHMARCFAPVLKANGGGAFVQLNSVVSIKCFANVATYSASKAAAYSITQALREMLTQQGTMVVSVHPGPIATDMADTAGLKDIAEPPSLVADALIKALTDGDFHAFAGSLAQKVGQAYQSYAENIVEANLAVE